MRKILFIECCKECFYFDEMHKQVGYCRHSEGEPIEIIDKHARHIHAIPLWCPLQDADTVEGG